MHFFQSGGDAALPDRTPFTPWQQSMIKNFLRARSRLPRQAPINDEVCSVSDSDPVENRERNALVRRALSLLDSRDRKILLLTLVHGLKTGEIATRVGLTSEVVRAWKSRALKKMIERISTLSQRSQPATGQPDYLTTSNPRRINRDRDYSPESSGAHTAGERRTCVGTRSLSSRSPRPRHYICGCRFHSWTDSAA